MTDRALIELAAKAAGINVDWWADRGAFLDIDALVMWNPLTDDGDALRLAVKLGIDVFPWQNKTHDERTIGIEAATRRAITRAAAEIGRAMP